MSTASFLLAGAQIGMSLFQAREQQAAARQTAEMEAQRQAMGAGRAAFSGAMERGQLATQFAHESSLRRRGFATALGAQRAATGAAGVIGGRTAQMAEAQSQAAFTREQAMARYTTNMATEASRYREQTRLQDAEMATRAAFAQAGQQQRQAQLSFLGSAIGTGFQLWERE